MDGPEKARAHIQLNNSKLINEKYDKRLKTSNHYRCMSSPHGSLQIKNKEKYFKISS